jgi:hypothetical protein
MHVCRICHAGGVIYGLGKSVARLYAARGTAELLQCIPNCCLIFVVIVRVNEVDIFGHSG